MDCGDDDDAAADVGGSAREGEGGDDDVQAKRASGQSSLRTGTKARAKASTATLDS